MVRATTFDAVGFPTFNWSHVAERRIDGISVTFDPRPLLSYGAAAGQIGTDRASPSRQSTSARPPRSAAGACRSGTVARTPSRCLLLSEVPGEAAAAEDARANTNAGLAHRAPDGPVFRQTQGRHGQAPALEHAKRPRSHRRVGSSSAARWGLVSRLSAMLLAAAARPATSSTACRTATQPWLG